MIDQKQWVELVQQLYDHYPTQLPWTPQTIEAWRHQLSDLTAEQIAAGVRWWCCESGSEYLPRCAPDLRRAAQQAIRVEHQEAIDAELETHQNTRSAEAVGAVGMQLVRDALPEHLGGSGRLPRMGHTIDYVREFAKRLEAEGATEQLSDTIEGQKIRNIRR